MISLHTSIFYTKLRPNVSRNFFIAFLSSTLIACGGGAGESTSEHEGIDSDNDGVIDARDAFPGDPTEQADSDGDSIGDNTDAFPNNPKEQFDSDNDGVGDNTDAFPLDPTRHTPEEIDSQPPLLREVSAINSTTNTIPEYTFHSNENGTIRVLGSCSTNTKNVFEGSNTIILNELTPGVYDDCKIVVTDASGNSSSELPITSFEIKDIIIPPTPDTEAPELTELSVIGEVSTYTPSYSFNTSEAGTLSFLGSCTSSTTQATIGSNLINFNYLQEGTYSDCKLVVTDLAGNQSLALNVTLFTVLDSTAPILSNPSQIEVGSIFNHNFSFESDEAGSITWEGSCSSNEISAVVGTNTVELNVDSYGTYSDCSLTVTDLLNNKSSSLNIPEFSIVPEYVYSSSWKGESDDLLVSFPSDIAGFEYHWSTDFNCDVNDFENCENAQMNILSTNDITITGEMADLNRSGAHILKTGSTQTDRIFRLADISYAEPSIGYLRNFRSTVFNGKIWASHGDNGDGYSNRTYSSTIWSSDDGQDWSPVATSIARSEHTLTAFNGKLWIVGGYDHEETYGYREYQRNVYFSEDGLNWTWRWGVYGPTSRSGHHAVVFNNKLWVFGGTDYRKTITENYLTDVWSMDANGDWTKHTDNGGYPTYIHAVVAFNNKLWAFTGTEVWSSTNGINWSQETISKGFHVNNGVKPNWIVFNNEIWLIGARSNNEIMKSSDGLSWDFVKTESQIGGSEIQQVLVHDDHLFLLGVGLDGYTLKSSDGINWRRGYSGRFRFPQVTQ
ncbi:MAG: hypothetical protein ACI8SR_003155 [Oceanicoccus sp.]|jgi:hypothetical protein